jgi:hypothetical protein
MMRKDTTTTLSGGADDPYSLDRRELFRHVAKAIGTPLA